ncbi:MAG: tetratricopeptide repeat protein [Planctomycetota bacterium]
MKIRLCWFLIFITSFSIHLGCQSFNSDNGLLQKPLSALRGKTRTTGGKRRGPRDIEPDEYLDPLGARNVDRVLLDDFSPSQLATTFKSRTAGIDETAAQEHYEQGQRVYEETVELMKQGSQSTEGFLAAANEFRLAAAKSPDSDIEMNALFYEGESYFFADRYVQSNRAYEKLIGRYSGSKYLDQAENRRYAIAVYWLKLDEQVSTINLVDPKRPKGDPAAEARRILHRIRIDDPTGKLADDATLTLGQAFMSAKRYYEAADAFEDLRRNYPGSKHVFDAHMLELEARIAGYQGKEYDDTPLRKADKLMQQIVRQFPGKSREQMEYLEEIGGRIRGLLAERDYEMGRYFESRGENRAAKFYYEKVAKKYQGSELGTAINEQIQEVASKPPVPKQHAKWLVDLFPNPEKEKPVILSGNNENSLLRR